MQDGIGSGTSFPKIGSYGMKDYINSNYPKATPNTGIRTSIVPKTNFPGTSTSPMGNFSGGTGMSNPGTGFNIAGSVVPLTATTALQGSYTQQPAAPGLKIGNNWISPQYSATDYQKLQFAQANPLTDVPALKTNTSNNPGTTKTLFATQGAINDAKAREATETSSFKAETTPEPAEVAQEQTAQGEQNKTVEEQGQKSGLKPPSWMSPAATAMGVVANTLLRSVDEKNRFNETTMGTRQGILQAAQSNPWSAFFSQLGNLADGLGAKAGITLSDLDKNAAKAAGVTKGAGLQNIINSVPGNSWIAGLFAKNTKKWEADTNDILRYSSAYGGVAQNAMHAEDLSGTRNFGGTTNKINSFIDRVSGQHNLATNIATEGELRKKSTAGQEYASQYYNTILGNNRVTNLAKQGMKFPDLETAKLIAIKFQNGGKMNIIPEGALHARKNNLSDIDESFESVTGKGIPVVIMEEGGEITQTAEIEGGEIILSLDLTKQLEEYAEVGTEEAMIVAGKLLADEIIINTEDKTGELLDEKVIEIGDIPFNAKIVSTEEDREKGLMGIKSLPADECMVFDFEETQSEVNFWMKDTPLHLDIIFVNSDLEVISVQEGVPNSEDLITESNVRYVIEANYNSGVKPGDDVFGLKGEENTDINSMHIIGSDGESQGTVEPNARIFSRIHTKALIRLAKKAFNTKQDSDYKKLGKKVFEIIEKQDTQEDEFVELPT